MRLPRRPFHAVHCPRTLWPVCALALLVPAPLAGCGAPEDDALASVGEAQQALLDCTTIQRGVFGSVADAQLSRKIGVSPVLDVEGMTNYGALPTAAIGLVAPGITRKTLLRFDLGFLPPGTTLSSATVTVNASNTGPGTVNAKRVTAPWAENTVTFQSWGNAQAAPVSGSFVSNPPAAAGARSFDLTALTQSWIDGTHANNGVVLIEEGAVSTTISTSEAANVALRPKLEVCVAVDLCAGVTCVAQDGCHVAGVCDPQTGLCSNPDAPPRLLVDFDDPAQPFVDHAPPAHAMSNISYADGPFVGAGVQWSSAAPSPAGNGYGVFDGGSALQIAASPDLQMQANQDFTLRFWFRSAGIDRGAGYGKYRKRMHALSFGDYINQSNLDVDFNDSDGNIGLWTYWRGGGSPGILTPGNTSGLYTDNAWHHYWLVRSAGTMTVHVGNSAGSYVTIGSKIDPAAIGSLTGPNYIGRGASAALQKYSWLGSIDHVRIDGCAFTPGM